MVYEIGPKSMLEVDREAQALGADIMGVFHSHTHTDAFPSPTDVRQATEQFILRMLPADKGQVGAFSDKIQFSGEFTNDRDDLVSALKDLQFGNPTRLYDAIDSSIDMLKDVEHSDKIEGVGCEGHPIGKRPVAHFCRRLGARQRARRGVGLERGRAPEPSEHREVAAVELQLDAHEHDERVLAHEHAARADEEEQERQREVVVRRHDVSSPA